jgi:hypothetical protein
MPFIEHNPASPDIGARAPNMRPRPPPAPSVGVLGTLGAAFQQENSVVSYNNYLAERGGYALDPTHNPLDIIKDTPYEANHLQRFVDSRSLADTVARMARIDREEHNDHLLDAAGAGGILARIVAGALDPTIAIPGGTIYRGVQIGRAAGRSAVSVGLATAGSVAAQEAILYGTQETRTVAGSAINIGVGTILGGILGGSISLLTRQQRNALEGVLGGLRREIDDEIARGPAPVGGATAGGAAPAARDPLTLASTMTPEFRASAAGLPAPQRAAVRVAGAAQDVATNMSPVTRLQDSPFEADRAAIWQMADAGLVHAEADAFVAASPSGNIETRIKMRRGPLVLALDQLDELYAQYYFTSAGQVSGFQKVTAGLRAAVASRTGQLGERLDKPAFLDEVGKTMRRGDTHTIAQVDAGAKLFRPIFEELRDIAIAQGQLPKDVSVLGAISYLTRVYNRERIKAQRDRWTNILRGHFTEMKRAATAKHEAKKAKKVGALEQELSDLTTPAAARPALLEKLAADLETLRSNNREFVALDAQLRDLRSAAAVARKAGNADAARDALIQEKLLRDNAGPAYARYVSERNALQSRRARIERTEPADPSAVAARPAALEKLKAREADALENARAQSEENIAVIAQRRDQALEQVKSIYDQRLKSTKKSERAGLRAQRNEAELRIEGKYNAEVAKEKRQFSPIERGLKKAFATERKALEAGLSGAEKSANRAANLTDIIGRVRAQKGDDLVEMLDAELPSLVDEVTNTLLGESVFRIPGLSIIQGPKGPLRARVLNIPDELIEDFLESNIDKVARVYVASMSGDIELTAKFGDPTMRDHFTRLLEEFNAKVNSLPAGKAGDKQRVALQRAYTESVRDMSALRDRARGMYGMPTDPDDRAFRFGKTLLNMNYIARLGGAGISQLTDFARPVMRYGMDTFGDAWVPFVSNFAGKKLARHELHLAGTALEMMRDSRALSMNDILDDFGRHTIMERGIQATADRFSAINLAAPATAAAKELAGMAAMAAIDKAARAVAAGKATKKQIGILSATMDEAMARRVAAHLEATSTQHGNMRLPNTEDWRLPGGAVDTQAIESYRALLNREVETVIVTPGMEKPLGFPSLLSPMMWRIISQFRTFNIVSTQRVLMAGLQQRDAAALIGVLNAMAIGAGVVWVKAQLRGEDTSTWNSAKWITEALDSSGTMGILSEVNATTEKLTGGRVGAAALTGKQVSRYASVNALGAAFGPSFGAMQDASAVFRLGSESWSHADSKALRRLIPLQNIFYLRWLFDQVEAGANSQFNIPPAQPRH